MTKLKTLKDLREKELEGYKGLIFKEDLKAEAIKWVKRFQDPLRSTDYSIEINWIKEFFNLTEEELR